MSLKNVLKKATLITAISLGPMAKADTLSSESVDFLNQGKTGATWTERIKLESPKNAYRVTKVGSLQADTFKKADINQTYDLFGNTALGLAVMNGKDEIVEDLIRQGADVNQANRRGQRPITEALISRSTSSQTTESKYKIIETLCKAGADINFKDADGETPLQVAANRLDGQAMRILKTYGADTSVKNELGQTPDQAYQSRLNGAIKNKAANTK
jgi:ankyrin repeat protein